MFYRFAVLLLSLLSFLVAAVDCSDVFPGDQTFAVNGSYSFSRGNQCNGSPCEVSSFETVDPLPSITPGGSYTDTVLSDGITEYTGWGLPKETTITFSGSGTAVMYFNSSVSIPKGTHLNVSGQPENVLIIVYGSLSIAKDSIINAIIYVAGSGNIAKDNIIKGAISVAGSLTVAKDGDYDFNNSYIDNLDDKGFCAGITTPEVDHFDIVHDGAGITCAPETVTIKACADASCSSLSTDTVSLDVQGNGSDLASLIFAGSTSFNFNYTNVGTVTLSVANPSITPTNATTCNGGGSCDINFAEAGFILDINSGNDVASCSSPNLVIKAVKLSDTGVNCAPAFSGDQPIDFSYDYLNPTTGSTIPLLAGTSMAANENVIQTRTITFDGNGEASLPIQYNDAGQVGIRVAENGSTGVTSATINKVFYPATLSVSATKLDTTPLDNTNSSGDPKQVAGDAFQVDLVAQCADGTVTPNYTPQATTAINLSVQQQAPTTHFGDLTIENGTNSKITATDTGSQAWLPNNSSATSFNASYSEVGIINIAAQDTGYFGHALSSNGYTTVGRFIPDHFTVSVTNNSFANACTIGAADFTYIGQPFTYLLEPEISITAENSNDEITQNYTETGYQKLEASNVSRTFSTEDRLKNGEDNSTKMQVSSTVFEGTLAKESNGVMKYTFNSNDSFTYTKDNNSLSIPFDATYDIAIATIEDSDGVNASAVLPQTISPIGGKLRFGRMVIDNSFGPETSNLPQVISIQYFNASEKFVVNSDDSCSALLHVNAVTENLLLSNISLNPLLSGVNDVNETVNDGISRVFELTAPGANNRGALGVSYNTPSWLKYDWNDIDELSDGVIYDDNPTAVATFGLFRGNDRIIYWREVNN
ncbi:DUF6701 domain-containing protein [Colwelliaceae bacterium 6471]